ncbi:MAG TPA: ABC transporter substrate-binding protein [Methylomirabilota bacterium]|nr:ABC transporter substrate-binding protein [Methylomirabilota bacterium]
MIEREVSRRAFVVLATALLASSRMAHGQPAKAYRIGFLGTTSPKSHGTFLDAFRDGLRERGYVEGRDVTIEARWAESDYDRLAALAGDLVRLNVDLILTHGTPGARAAKEATRTIPIVVALAGDVVATGLVSSLARPGGNLTGVSFFFPELNAKRVEMLKEALPRLKRVAVLMNDANAANLVTFDTTTRMARTVGFDTVKILAHSAEDFERAFGEMERARCEAVVIYEDPLFVAQATQLAALAQRRRLPSVGFREYADAGGLLGFGVNFPDAWRRASGFADRIFKGGKPGDLPMEQPGKYDTVVNLRTARALRLAIQPRVLHRADRILE